MFSCCWFHVAAIFVNVLSMVTYYLHLRAEY
jgi:hypothetical protein